jgi:hypothetical protein
MKTLWCKNHENPSDRISHAWAPLSRSTVQYSTQTDQLFELSLSLSLSVQSEEDGDEDPTPGERTHGRRLRQLHPHGSRGQGRQASPPPPGQGRQAHQQPPPGQEGGPGRGRADGRHQHAEQARRQEGPPENGALDVKLVYSQARASDDRRARFSKYMTRDP